jgi:light-independent protochlorophyllide reductase subunit N
LTILNESGTPDVLSPLYCVGSLGETLPHALFVVLGTQAEAYATQSLLSTLAPENPRVAYVTLEPDTPEQGALAVEVIKAAAGYGKTDLCLIFVSRAARLLGIDAAFEVRLAERRLGLPVRAVDPGSGGFTTSAEDAVARVLLGLCPAGSAAGGEEALPAKRGGLLRLLGRSEPEPRGYELRPVVLAGNVTRSCRRELAGELEQVGVEVAGFVPAASPEELPPLEEDTVLAPVQPFMVETTRAAEERGIEVVRTLMPIGVDGTARFIRDVAWAAGREINELARAREVLREVEDLRNRLRGLRVFFTGDTGLEIPLARTLAGSGAVVLEVGTPRLNRAGLVAELQTLGVDIDIVESPEWTRQLERVDETRPDLVVAGPGLHGPLTARGHLCRLSLDFLRQDIYGYHGVRRMLELFVRPLERAARLDSLEL